MTARAAKDWRSLGGAGFFLKHVSSKGISEEMTYRIRAKMIPEKFTFPGQKTTFLKKITTPRKKLG